MSPARLETEKTPTTGIGVDGCRGGWVWVSLSDDEAEFGVVGAFEELLPELDRGGRLVVDIPIGLPAGEHYPRDCDRDARRLLGPRRGRSVFNVPGREVLETDGIEDARQLSRELSGVAFSNQLWSLRPKILEVDRVLRENPDMRGRVRETHPELAFWCLNGEGGVDEPKRTRSGFERRVAILSRYDPRAEAVVERALHEFPRSVLARDDVVDALVCALVARSPRLKTVPAEPPLDTHGLPMEMCLPADPSELPSRLDFSPGGADAAAPESVPSRGDSGSAGPTLSDAFDRAIHLARTWHRNDVRKGSDIPYIAHLLGTVSFVLEAGGDETQAIAALFHDALEDAPDMEAYRTRRKRIAAEFGDDVLGIVEVCTDGSPEEKRAMAWLDRKRRYLSRLERDAARSLLVTAADKLHNARAILYDVRRQGPDFLDTFHGSRDETLAYYRRLAEILREAFPSDTRPGRLATELARVVAAIEAEVEDAGRGHGGAADTT